MPTFPELEKKVTTKRANGAPAIREWEVISRRWIAVLVWEASALVLGVWLSSPPPELGLPGNFWLLVALTLFNFGVITSTSYKRLSAFVATLLPVVGYGVYVYLALVPGLFSPAPLTTIPDILALLSVIFAGAPIALGAETISIWRSLESLRRFRWPVRRT